MSTSPPALRFFTPKTLATFRAIAGCIVPSEPDSPGADSESVMLLADRVLAERPARDRRLLNVFLNVIELAPFIRYGRRFTRLSDTQKEAVLSFFERGFLGPLRQGFFGVKTFALMGYYGDTRNFAELQYPGPKLSAPYYQLRAEKKP